MLPETIAVLAAHDFIRGEESVNRDKLAVACRDLLIESEVETEADVQDRALIVAEIRHRLLGPAPSEEAEHELDQIVSQLTAPRAKVQNTLDDGLVLCSMTVTRRLSNNGDDTMIDVKRPGRFVTANHDLIVKCLWYPYEERLERSAVAFQKVLALTVGRQPELAARRPGQLEIARGRVNAQLALEEGGES